MYYWYIKVDFGKGGIEEIYFKTGINHLKANIPQAAVNAGMLLGVNVRYVTVVEEITKEKYYEYMYD